MPYIPNKSLTYQSTDYEFLQHLINATLGTDNMEQNSMKHTTNKILSSYQLCVCLYTKFNFFLTLLTQSSKMYCSCNANKICIALVTQGLVNVSTVIHKLFETNSSFNAKQSTTGKVQFLFFRSFLLVLEKYSFREED